MGAGVGAGPSGAQGAAELLTRERAGASRAVSTEREKWWRHAAVYQIYPRSFADSNGDGIGDLGGVIAHLDYLAWLGVDALWLSPIFSSPMFDFGYDVSNYCDIDPVFGDLAIFDHLVAEAHHRNIKVMLDWVPNHTSTLHPWFVDASSSRDSVHHDWYIWRDANADGSMPTNWHAQFTGGQPSWTWNETIGRYYLHSFLPQQPDLNWDNPAVEAAMHETLRFWLDRGVDGFRMDVVHLIGKDFANVAPGQEGTFVVHNDVEITHERLRRIRTLLDSYDGERTSVGEVYLLDPTRMARYYGDNDELHLSFNFAFMWTSWTAQSLRKQIDETIQVLATRDAAPTWVLSNHDAPRHRTRYGNDEQAARCAAVMLCTLPGTVFLYQGEELGLVDADIPPQRVVDPGGRDGCRAPIPWTADDNHGWSVDPWLPFPPEANSRNAASLRKDDTSILHLYRQLLALRHTANALSNGAFHWLDLGDEVLAYERSTPDERVVVIINFGERLDVRTSAQIQGEWTTLIDVHSATARPWDGIVQRHGAVAVRAV
jgi:alpha-glucosidase